MTPKQTTEEGWVPLNRESHVSAESSLGMLPLRNQELESFWAYAVQKKVTQFELCQRLMIDAFLVELSLQFLEAMLQLAPQLGVRIGC